MPHQYHLGVNRPSGKLRALDLFCGAGGSSCGARMAGVEIAGGVDIAPLATEAFADNFPGANVFRGDIRKLSPKAVLRQTGPIDLLLASPECTNHSCAKGSADRSEESRLTAFEATRFARRLKPRWVVIENVIQMRTWSRYGELLRAFGRMGYQVREQVLDASDFGVPQARRRLFLLCDLAGMPPEVVPMAGEPPKVRDIIEPNGSFPFTPLRRRGRAVRTLRSAGRAIRELGPGKPFLVVYYGTDGCGGWQRTDAPLRTITTLDRFAYVKPSKAGHMMRMLQVPELKLAMGFPRSYRLDRGVRRDRIRLLGNGVCPPVMKAIVETLCREGLGTVQRRRAPAFLSLRSGASS